MRTGIIKTSAAVAILAVAGGASYYYYNNKPTTAAAPSAARARPVPVLLATVEQKDVPVSLSVVGRAESFSSVSVRSRVDGQVSQVMFQPGQHVKKGQVLFRFDPSPLEAQLRQAQGNRLRDQAQLDKAKADLERYSDLARKGFVAPTAVDGYRAAVETLEATVKLDDASVDYARIQLSFATVLAPMDGIAGAVLVFSGGNVKANDTVVVVVNQVQPMYVSFSIPESQLDGVRALQRKGAVPVTAKTRDGSKTTIQGKLAFIDNTIDTSTGTILLKAVYPNADERLTPGQFVDVGLITRVINDAVSMPIQAMQMGPNGNIVFVATADNKVEVRPVKNPYSAGTTLVVPEGFAPGEKVVIDGQLRLSPGASIEVRTPGAGKGGPGKGGGKGESKAGEGKAEGTSEVKAEGAGEGKAPAAKAGAAKS